MKLTRKDLLCKGVSVESGEEYEGWYVEGNVYQDDTDGRKRTSYIISVYPDLRKSTTGVTSLHGFIEVIPKSVTLVEIKNNE